MRELCTKEWVIKDPKEPKLGNARWVDPNVRAIQRKLEESLGVSLFDRSSSGMALTPSGRSLLTEAEGILAGIQQLKQTAQHFQGRPAGRLSIGTVLDPATLRVGDFLARAIESYPLIEIELHQLFSGAAIAGVRDGELDAAFFFGALADPQLSAEPLRTLTYRVALPADWGLDARRVEWAVIAARPWILAPETSSHRELAMQLFAERGIAPTQVIEADNETVSLNLIESGVGASIARDGAVMTRAGHQQDDHGPPRSSTRNGGCCSGRRDSQRCQFSG